MSRKYSSWASNPAASNFDLSTLMRLTTVGGNEQDQLRNFQRVEAIPHMYINVDAPPPTTTKLDAQAIQPTMIQNQTPSYFAAHNVIPPPSNSQTKIWPVEKPSRNPSVVESGTPASKRTHKHKHHHHHHHHHGDKHHHHHHRHHSRRHRAKSADSIRNRQHRTSFSSSKVMLANPQYIEQDQQQQQPMIVYREVPSGDGYSVNTNAFASVPYGAENETTFVDDQQAPVVVYRDTNFQQPQQQQTIMADGLSQDVFYNQDQDGIIQQADPFFCPSQQQQQQQSSQIVYCTDPNQQDYFCTSNNTNFVQQSITPQSQFVCVDNASSTIQPTIINQIPVFNPLTSNNTNCQSIVNVPQSSLQRTTSFVIQQPQSQPFQIIQQPQPLQVIQQPQPLQIIQQPQQLQFIPNQQAQAGQFLQLSSATPQMIQTIQPQILQSQPVLQTLQMPAQAIAASPQILYQRPYDPVVLPIQNQQVALANSPLVALSQPSYAPARIAPAVLGGQSQGPNMFRHALLQTVAGRTGVPLPSAANAVQLMQPTIAANAASNPNVLLPGNIQRSASLPIVPLTPGGLLIPFQPSNPSGFRHGPFSHAAGHPSNLRNFNDIRQQIQQQRAQISQNLRQQQQQNYNRIPSPPVISAASRNQSGPYSPSVRSSGTPFPSIAPSTYARPSSVGLNYSRAPSSGLNYSQPSYAGSNAGSIRSAPYYPLRS